MEISMIKIRSTSYKSESSFIRSLISDKGGGNRRKFSLSLIFLEITSLIKFRIVVMKYTSQLATYVNTFTTDS